MKPPVATVVGQLARDLVLSVGAVPDTGAAADATDRREQLGGKGANQAVGLAQLGVVPRLVAVAGEDIIGDVLLDQARRDGIDVTAVVRRPGALTGLIVELLDSDGQWRYVQHLSEEVLLTVRDVERARDVISGADAVLVQLQQPAAAALAAARIGHDAGRLVVLDGVPEEHRDELLAAADVVRADDQEARLLLDGPVTPAAARRLLDDGPRLLALGVEDGNLFVWKDGHVRLPLTGGKPVDTTGGGDAFTAALTASLLRGEDYSLAARWAVAASGATVTHVSGRPSLAGLQVSADG
ncbi:PfkB family carbohydrate kinase [Actinoplanes friuliensis]|uniref:Putative PfkB-family carbohydrate kinase n=1 Tax=Actinoplanes friuliensis DSM 7358 TaxID=1246995 RepID=U5W7S0_9ACTN|nr:PfkB family carbohydrate kinase [Actinoplanes friuliensis]AGZ45253.1 putative PfkB-family carbohydrate kinase [Actinoplanes friuliensis DSM 7358]